MTASPTSPTASARATGGKYCPNCGVPLLGVPCPACGAPLSPGAKFCHSCGANAPALTVAARPAVPRSGVANAFPWAVAAIALVAVVALAAGQRFGRTETGEAGVAPPTSQRGIVTAPDISSLTPAQRAERLYDRVMGASERGRDDSVRFFMPMAIGAYEALGDLSQDQRYDLGRLGDAAGDQKLASAQADSILRKNPQHLLGLVLASRAARLRGDNAAARRFLDRLVRAERSERQKQLPEYLVHQNDIDAALAEARTPTR